MGARWYPRYKIRRYEETWGEKLQVFGATLFPSGHFYFHIPTIITSFVSEHKNSDQVCQLLSLSNLIRWADGAKIVIGKRKVSYGLRWFVESYVCTILVQQELHHTSVLGQYY